MSSVSDKSLNACPACNYEQVSNDMSCRNGEQMKCLACGITWREFGDPAASAIPTFIRAKKPENTNTPRLQSMPTIDATVSKSTHVEYVPKQSGRANLYLSGIAGIAFLFCLVASTFIFQSLTANKIDKTVIGSIKPKALQISEVEVQERVRPDGKKIFTVRGLLNNTKEEATAIPRVAVILRKENGDELTRWYYSAPMPKLGHGSKLRFASSIQYDTPFAVSAEAVFQ